MLRKRSTDNCWRALLAGHLRAEVELDCDTDTAMATVYRNLTNLLLRGA